MDSFVGATEEFLGDLRLAGRAERTVGEHRAELRRLGRFFAGELLDWQSLTGKEVKRYCRLRAHKGHSSRANMLCTDPCLSVLGGD